MDQGREEKITRIKGLNAIYEIFVEYNSILPFALFRWNTIVRLTECKKLVSFCRPFIIPLHLFLTNLCKIFFICNCKRRVWMKLYRSIFNSFDTKKVYEIREIDEPVASRLMFDLMQAVMLCSVKRLQLQDKTELKY